MYYVERENFASFTAKRFVNDQPCPNKGIKCYLDPRSHFLGYGGFTDIFSTKPVFQMCRFHFPFWPLNHTYMQEDDKLVIKKITRTKCRYIYTNARLSKAILE